jgi:hypothetical protein
MSKSLPDCRMPVTATPSSRAGQPLTSAPGQDREPVATVEIEGKWLREAGSGPYDQNRLCDSVKWEPELSRLLASRSYAVPIPALAPVIKQTDPASF